MRAGGRADQGQFLSLQIVRACAALLVLLFHLCITLADRFGVGTQDMFRMGADGVDIFFVLSGFIMCHATQGEPRVTGAKFAYNRIVRIVPLYFALTLAVFAVALLAPSLLGASAANGVHLLKSLAFIPYERADGSVQPILFLGWTLNYEMFFYAAFTLALAVTRRPILAVIALFLAVAATGAILHPSSVILKFYTQGIILEFVWGCLLYLVFSKYPGALKLAWVLGFAGLALLILQNFVEIDAPREVAKGLPAAAIVATALTWRTAAGPLARFMGRLGDASYSLYLVHPYVIQLAAVVVLSVMGAGLPAIVALIVLSTSLTVAGSLMSFMFFERPSNRFLRRQFPSRRPSTKVPASNKPEPGDPGQPLSP